MNKFHTRLCLQRLDSVSKYNQPYYSFYWLWCVAEPELKRTLQSLACAKLRPLRKHPTGREINNADLFSLDPNFSHEKYRIKINQVQLKETKEDNKETHERVHADRQFETQAAIVRIMKSKKRIAHNLLVAEVIEVTKKRGVLSLTDIKKNIDR